MLLRFVRSDAPAWLIALVLLPACAEILGADFDVERPGAGGQAGMSSGSGGGAGEAGAQGGTDDGVAGTGGTAGSAGAAGGGGSAGSGPGALDGAEGVVVVSVGGEAGCSGVLLTHRFVLAPASCVDGAATPSEVTVALAGSLSAALAVAEVDSSATRDLALLHLEEAVEVGEQTSGFFRAYYPLASSELDGQALTCMGAAVRGELQVEAVNSNVADFGDRATLSGDAELEIGAGCYAELGGVSFLTALKLEDGWLALGDAEARAFITRGLVAQRSLDSQRQCGVHSVVATESGEIRLTWLVPVSPYPLVHATFDEARERVSEVVIDPPPDHEEDVDYEIPASAITSDGTLHVVITVPSTNQHWYYAKESGATDGTWSVIAASNEVNTGSSLVNSGDGHLHLLTRWHFDVHYAFFDRDEGWTDTWEPASDTLGGDPAAVAWGEGKISVFGRSSGQVRHAARIDGDWQSWEDLGAAITGTGEARTVAATSLRPGRIDVFAQAPAESPSNSELLHRFYEGGVWLSDWVPTGVPVTLYSSLSGTSGGGRVFVTFDNGSEDFELIEFPRD